VVQARDEALAARQGKDRGGAHGAQCTPWDGRYFPLLGVTAFTAPPIALPVILTAPTATSVARLAAVPTTLTTAQPVEARATVATSKAYAARRGEERKMVFMNGDPVTAGFADSRVRWAPRGACYVKPLNAVIAGVTRNPGVFDGRMDCGSSPQ
jgi:hypothetical protein